jgi:hypothetical protein
MHSYLVSQLASDRHCQMLAHAEQQRPARQLLALRKPSRRTDRTERRIRRAGRTALRLRADPGP